ncbi:MAG: hypothetical protein ACLGHP_06135, partial [Vicinamibacteria bacterium]
MKFTTLMTATALLFATSLVVNAGQAPPAEPGCCAAAAAHVVARGFTPIVFERGGSVAAHLESYRHVRLFSPWRYNLDKAAVAL